MKTWEMMKVLTENTEKKFRVVGAKHLISKLSQETNVVEVINISQEGITINPGLDWDWEEVKHPVTFMQAIKSGKKILYQNPNDGDEYYCELDEFFAVIGDMYTSYGLADYIKKDEFYIED